MKEDAVLLVYGGGGHREQMRRLHLKLAGVLESKPVFIGYCEKGQKLDILSMNIEVPALRDKYSWFKTMYNAPFSTAATIHNMLVLTRKFRIKLIISTGPGVAVLPSLLGKLLGIKTVYIETWSRYYSSSMAGKIMYRIANEFYIQNKNLRQFYPKAKYGGML